MTTVFLIIAGILVAVGYVAYRILQTPLYTDLGPRLMRQMERDIMGREASHASRTPRHRPVEPWDMLHQATRPSPRRRPTIIDADFKVIRPPSALTQSPSRPRIGTRPTNRRR